MPRDGAFTLTEVSGPILSIVWRLPRRVIAGSERLTVVTTGLCARRAARGRLPIERVECRHFIT
jgi:hypothetical protein